MIKENGVTEAIKKRLFNYYKSAIDAGADIIFNTCSSVGEVASEARKSFPIPIVKIDDAMTMKAVSEAKSIGVLATLSTTLAPTVRLLKFQSDKKGKEIEVYEGLAEGAYEAIISGDSDNHDKLIIGVATKISDQCELFVLAQGSMARMRNKLKEITGKEVLASPVFGILNVKEEIEKLLR